MMTIVTHAEDKFGVRIPDDEVKNLATVGDAVSFINGAPGLSRTPDGGSRAAGPRPAPRSTAAHRRTGTAPPEHLPLRPPSRST